ncbi:MAG: sugar phosphate nucleotidyltransferase [Brevinemataceae bacterium]
MKIVLPLAGKGTRLLPHTENTPKPLMFVAGKTILDYLMEQLIPLNPTEFVFIVGYLKEDIENYLRKNYPNLPMCFIEQTNPQGLGHAVYQARDAFYKDEDMLVVLGDQTFKVDWNKMLENSYNRISIAKVTDPSSFGIVECDKQGFILEMEEKPENPKSNSAISGIYYFPSAQAVFSALAYQIAQNIRTRGEIQLTDSMKIMMKSGEKFQALEISDWNDCGNHADLIAANQTLLSSQHNSYSFDDVQIIPPVWIDPSVEIKASTIGPNVAIASGVSISESQLSNTIVCADTKIESCCFDKSYLGSNLVLKDQEESESYTA